MEETSRSQTPREDFFLLGAGFSRAIDRELPLLTDLGVVVLRELGLDASTLDAFGGDVEAWLSFLAGDQPWLSDEANMHNSATFLEASKVIGRVVADCEDEATMKPPSEWLMKLVWEWASRDATVATMNYDTLVERVALTVSVAHTPADLYALPTAERWPAGSARAISVNPPPGAVPRLFKLHGSTNWYYGGIDSPASEPIVLHRRHVRRWQTGEAAPPERELFLYKDLVPLIVPPSGTKTPYFRNRAMRAQWQGAAERLRRASRLVVIGYSLPATDLQVRQFLAINAQPGLRITVVDPGVRAAEQVQALLPGRSVDVIDGDRAVEDFVSSYTGSIFRAWTTDGDNDQAVRKVSVDGQAEDEVAGLSEPDDRSINRNWIKQEFTARWPDAPDTVIGWSMNEDASIRELHVAFAPRGCRRASLR